MKLFSIISITVLVAALFLASDIEAAARIPPAPTSPMQRMLNEDIVRARKEFDARAAGAAKRGVDTAPRKTVKDIEAELEKKKETNTARWVYGKIRRGKSSAY